MGIVTLTNGVTLTYPTGVIATVDNGGSPPDPGPGPSPGPGPDPIPPGVGYQVITPPATGQNKYSFNGPMVLDLVDQPPGNAHAVAGGRLTTAPQIGGDLEAGDMKADYIDLQGNPQTITAGPPATIWYSTDVLRPGSVFQAKPGSTIRVSVLNPVRPWYLEYVLPNI
jgi:hypothetical protein